MIEVFGIKLTYEALAFIAAFVASEVIGASKLKNNSVAGLLKALIDGQRPFRKEDDKLEAIKLQLVTLYNEVQKLDK